MRAGAVVMRDAICGFGAIICAGRMRRIMRVRMIVIVIRRSLMLSIRMIQI